MGAYFYLDQAGYTLTSAFVNKSFGFAADEMVVYNDDVGGSNKIVISFDGVNTAIIIPPSSTQKFGKLDHPIGVYIKYSGAAPSYRISAWQNQ